MPIALHLFEGVAHEGSVARVLSYSPLPKIGWREITISSKWACSVWSGAQLASWPPKKVLK